MSDLYTAIQQQLHFDLTSSTLFILLAIAIVLGLVAIFVSGGLRVATKGRLKWIIIHSISLLVIGYLLKNFTLNKYIEIIIFAVGVTLISSLFRYLMYAEKFKLKNRFIWLGINLFTLLFANIIFELLKVTEPVLKLFFAAFCLTWIGTMVHNKFKQ